MVRLWWWLYPLNVQIVRLERPIDVHLTMHLQRTIIAQIVALSITLDAVFQLVQHRINARLNVLHHFNRLAQINPKVRLTPSVLTDLDHAVGEIVSFRKLYVRCLDRFQLLSLQYHRITFHHRHERLCLFDQLILMVDDARKRIHRFLDLLDFHQNRMLPR
uniref:Putative secreted protein n=1 Tax=Anopheles darlingi TaxID=43151 RepID=A0A2M4DN66_ANODA